MSYTSKRGGNFLDLFDAIKENHWRDVGKEGENNKNINDLKWEV